MQIASDCPNGVCVAGSLGAELLQNLDTNFDGMISVGELESNVLFEGLTSSTVDLFDGQGRFNPGCDGVLDGLSVAVAFSAAESWPRRATDPILSPS